MYKTADEFKLVTKANLIIIIVQGSQSLIIWNRKRPNGKKITSENDESFKNLSLRGNNHVGIGLRLRRIRGINSHDIENDRLINDEKIGIIGKGKKE